MVDILDVGMKKREKVLDSQPLHTEFFLPSQRKQLLPSDTTQKEKATSVTLPSTIHPLQKQHITPIIRKIINNKNITPHFSILHSLPAFFLLPQKNLTFLPTIPDYINMG
ncbi:MAG: hypothetical protein SD837_00230 [Candidatus Electrothrix scaldis]|nr:MAG: hypothetical protein SD837_00230 [Candidatus Electrothrix sp. GW3-3]